MLLFRRPTVAELASELDADASADVQPGLPPIVPLGRVIQRTTEPEREKG
jgi:hypothetical protein